VRIRQRALNLDGAALTYHTGLVVVGAEITMKIALLAVLGLALGALGGAALGIGAGLAWIGLAKTSGLDSGTLVFFTFMPLGAAIGGIGGALLFAVVAIRDAEIVIERQPARQRDR